MSRSLSHGHLPRSIQQNILPANRHHGIGENILSSPVSHNSCICKDSVFNQFMQVFFILNNNRRSKKSYNNTPQYLSTKVPPSPSTQAVHPKPFIPPVSPLPISLMALSCLYSSTLITSVTIRDIPREETNSQIRDKEHVS